MNTVKMMCMTWDDNGHNDSNRYVTQDAYLTTTAVGL